MAALHRKNLDLQKLLTEQTTQSSSASPANVLMSSLGPAVSSLSGRSGLLESPDVQAKGLPQFDYPLDLARAAALLEALTEASDNDSCLLLAKLRLGGSWGELADTLIAGQKGTNVEKSRSSSLHNDEEELSSLAGCHHAIVEDLAKGKGGKDSDIPGIDDKGRQSNSFHQPNYSFISRRRTRHDCSFDRNVWMQKGQSLGRDGLEDQDKMSASGFIVGFNSAHNIFGNMTFADAIGTNHHFAATQAAQKHNLKLPIWAMRLTHSPPCVDEPFDVAWLVLMEALNDGLDMDALCGQHVCLDALDNESAFNAAPLLSQVIANMIKSIKSDDAVVSTTQYGMMWLHWLLWRWMVNPSSESYHAIPVSLRPQTYQFFTEHVRVYDFVLWPALRQHVCSLASGDLRWLTEAYKTIKCDWSQDVANALFRDGTTRQLDLNPQCKNHLAMASSWSMGPSVAAFLPEAWSYDEKNQSGNEAMFET